MQAAFKYRETTPSVGTEAELSSLQVSGFGPLNLATEELFFFFFFKETDMNCVDDKICL